MQPFHDRSVVITFCSREAQPTLERSGFGEGFLFNYGIDAIHIVCSDNSWYQYDDIYVALDAAVGHLESYANKVAMGWSMGGYAAVNFSEYLGVDRVIAVSPQFSADPTKVPLETRWRRDRRRINFRHDLIHTLTRGRRQFCIVFDDRLALDRHHVERIKEWVDIVELPLPHSGHPAGSLLASLGILATTITRLIEGTFNRDEFTDQLRTLTVADCSPYRRLARRIGRSVFKPPAGR
jgi:pimeloyl-ACP methyl ester carboxylesterase